MAKSSNSIWALLIIAAIAITLGLVAQQRASAPAALKKAILLPAPKDIPATDFITHTGVKISEQAFHGKWQLLFFGFTHCPDICPSTLYLLKQTLEQLEVNGIAEQLQVSMVTVDPQRDTPNRLAQYVPFFHPSFMGLTTDADALETFTRKLGVLYVAREPDENGNYDVDHSTALILLNPQGQYAGAITAPHSVEDLVHDLTEIISADNEAGLQQTTQQPQRSQLMAESLRISEPWIRPAPPGTDALAGYLTANNEGKNKVIVVGADSPMFDEIMIHSTNLDGGMASMDHVDKLVIAPGTRAEFSPMGTHLMLMDPVSTINLGQLVPITLRLEDGSSQQAIFSVKHQGEAN